MRLQAQTVLSAHRTQLNPPSTSSSLELELSSDTELTPAPALSLQTILRPFRHPDLDAPARQVIEIDGFVAAGGMGRVFYALRHLPGQAPQPVALKRLVRHLPDRDMFLASLFHEGELGLWLKHPNIVRTWDVLSFTDGAQREHALVLEWIEGTTLAHLMSLQPFTPAMAAFVILQAAEGLAHAVSTIGPSGRPLGAIHRDLKPANLMLTRDGVVKVMDFGIARYDGRTQLTRGLTIKGTIEYAPPEILLGCTDELTPAADIFSLGLIFYRLLAGKPLVKCAEPMQYLHVIPGLDAGPILQQLPVSLEPLQPVLRRMLQTVPEARYSDAWELAFTLRQLLPTLPGGERYEQDLVSLCRRAPIPEPSRTHLELDRHAYVPPIIVPSARLRAIQSPTRPEPSADEKTVPLLIAQPVAEASRVARPDLWVLLALVLLNLGLMALLWQSAPGKRFLTLPTQPAATSSTGPESPGSAAGGLRSGLPGASPATSSVISGRTSEAPATLITTPPLATEPPLSPTARLVKEGSKSQQAGSIRERGTATVPPSAVGAANRPDARTPPAVVTTQRHESVKQVSVVTSTSFVTVPEPLPGIGSSASGSLNDSLNDSASTSLQAHAILEARATQIEQQEIYLTSIPLGDIWLDGRKVASQRSVTVRVLTGEHQLRMIAPDGVEHRFTIQVDTGPVRTYRWLFEQEKLQIVSARGDADARSSFIE